MRPTSTSQILRQADLPAFLVTNLVNLRYLTSLKLSFGAILALPRRMILLVDGRYLEMASRKAPKGMRVQDISTLHTFLRDTPECGFEADHITVDQLSRWKTVHKNTKFVQKTGVIEFFRRSKDESELSAFRRAQKITRELIRRVPSALRVGTSERAVGWKLRAWAEELGADELGFEPIVAFGTHTSRPHHRPTDRKLQQGHIVQIDVGAKYKGYCADQSAIFFTGAPTLLMQQVCTAVAEAKDAAMHAIKAGVTNHELDKIARDILKKAGFESYFVHSLGHGLGLEVHEGLNLSSRAPKTKLLKNEIITIEPGVYLPGKFGIRLEEEIIVE